ncbi:MAG: ABC transporter substrate-binding protein [Flavobacterium sp.]|nr:ABC transporter substrate-binding protein [Flavobacterium sp.]
MSIKLIDQIDKLHIFSSIPRRIVSLVPSQSELLTDLGLENQIIGITKFCVHPASLLKNKTKVGGTKNPNFDKIKALNPDIIICNKEENTKEIIEICEEICTVWTTDIITIKDNFRMIDDFGQIFNCQESANKLNSKIKNSLLDFENYIKDKPIKKTAYFIWKKPYMVVGCNNYINEILKLNRLENIYEYNNFDSNRYPEIEIENLSVNKDLDLILLSSEPYPFNDKDFDEIQFHSKNAKIILVDGEMFSWHGSRILLAIEYFKQLHI